MEKTFPPWTTRNRVNRNTTRAKAVIVRPDKQIIDNIRHHLSSTRITATIVPRIIHPIMMVVALRRNTRISPWMTIFVILMTTTITTFAFLPCVAKRALSDPHNVGLVRGCRRHLIIHTATIRNSCLPIVTWTTVIMVDAHCRT